MNIKQEAAIFFGLISLTALMIFGTMKLGENMAEKYTLKIKEQTTLEDVKKELAEMNKPIVSARLKAKVTGYNTVEGQTDSTPCISASGDNICGRNDVVACPRAVPFGTKIIIDEKTYECLDRTAPKHDGTFDISCDKDTSCPAKVTGYKEIIILK